MGGGVGGGGVCLLRIHTKMSEYEGIQLVKCDPPALLYSTIANTRLTRNWCESIPEKVSRDVPHEGGCGRGWWGGGTLASLSANAHRRTGTAPS